MVAITLLIPYIFSCSCNAPQIDCELTKLVYIGWKMSQKTYKLPFHYHYTNNCSFRAILTKRTGKLTKCFVAQKHFSRVVVCTFYPRNVVSSSGMLSVLLLLWVHLKKNLQRIIFSFHQEIIGLNIKSDKPHEEQSYPRIASELNEIRTYIAFLTVSLHWFIVQTVFFLPRVTIN